MGIALMLSATVCTIIDVDQPWSGLINMNNPNHLRLINGKVRARTLVNHYAKS
jgi:hypothetical protein